MSDIGRDAHQAVRGLARRPGFALLVVATLGLGIGATTTIYSVVDAVVVRALPYPDADALVRAGHLYPGREWVEGTSLHSIHSVSGPTLRDWRERTRTLAQLEAVEFRMNLFRDEHDVAHILPFGDVTPGFLGLLGARIQLGRSFLPGDALETEILPVILSHEEWASSAGSDPSIIGKHAPGLPRTIVIGVIAPGFITPEALFGQTRIGHWRPMDVRGERYAYRADRRLQVIGRLAPGAAIEDARSELATIQADLARAYADDYVSYQEGTALGAGVNGLQAQTVGATGRTLVLFFASSVLLLLIAAINAANLLFVRGLDRERETAVRLAIGAGRWRVARTVLVESLVLALAGGALGALLAAAGVEAFVRLVPSSMPRLGEVALNGRVLAITAIGSICVGIVAGMVPALRQSSHDLAIHSRSIGATQPRAGLRLRMSLVALQVALAVVLGVGASLLFRSFLNIATADPGFEPRGVITFTGFLKRPGFQTAVPWQLWDDLLTEARAARGVTAEATSALPFQPPDLAPAFQLWEDPATMRRPAGAGYVVTPGYFELMGIAVLEGRAFDQTDGPNGRRVVIANRAFAREFFGSSDAVGRRIRLWNFDGSLAEADIVGVVANTVQARVEEGMLPALYFPYMQVGWPQVNVVLRSQREPTSLAADLRAAALRFNPIAPAPPIERLTDRVRVSLTEPRFQAMLFVSFASVAVLLAAIGLYGTLAHSVGRRARELGIRMAVGADRPRIFAMVMRQGLTVVACGLVIGIAGATLVTRFLRSFLFGVGVLDPLTFAMTAALLTLIAALAIVRPAGRATGIDPARSIRSEG